MRLKKFVAVAGLALALGGCASLAQVAGQVGQLVSSPSAHQVQTLAAALSAAKLATDAVDLYVQVGNPDRATLLQLQSLNEGVHTALTNLQAANMRGESLVFAAFNEALAAFRAYAAAKGAVS
jgi:hypothetical protein